MGPGGLPPDLSSVFDNCPPLLCRGNWKASCLSRKSSGGSQSPRFARSHMSGTSDSRSRVAFQGGARPRCRTQHPRRIRHSSRRHAGLPRGRDPRAPSLTRCPVRTGYVALSSMCQKSPSSGPNAREPDVPSSIGPASSGPPVSASAWYLRTNCSTACSLLAWGVAPRFSCSNSDIPITS